MHGRHRRPWASRPSAGACRSHPGRADQLGHLGLGSRPGETVLAKVIKPGQSKGDLLAKSEASPEPAPTGDSQSPAEAKLFNELQDNLGALQVDDDVIALTDPDGDGVYTADYPTREPGHYTFLFAVQGRTNEAGIVSRQQLKSAFARAVPDPSQTAISVDTVSLDGA